MDREILYVIDKCPHCGKEFYCDMIPQEPGFRWQEDEICPYCGEVVSSSMDWEFITREKKED